MSANIQISSETSKGSLRIGCTKEHLRAYFEMVCKIIDEKQDEFPVNLDDVWELAYKRKDYATDALKKDFIEDEDYICTSAKTEVGSTRYEYRLTVKCFEFFIARKVRPVFEVYRRVFHGAIQQRPKVPTTFKEALLLAAAQQEQIEQQQKLIAEKTEQLDESKEWFSIKRWAQMHRKNWRNYKWRVLKALSTELGYEVKKIFDANYDEVNIYHKDVFVAAYGE